MKNQILSLNSNYGLFFVILICAVLEITGCSSTPKKNLAAYPESLETYENSKPVLVRTSEEDSRPDWTKRSVSEAQGKLYFTGGFFNGVDYSVSIRCANAESLKVSYYLSNYNYRFT